MAYCPECGSVNTNEDIFCGNCGIALTPIAPSAEDETLSAGAAGVSNLPGIEPSKNEPAKAVSEKNFVKPIEDVPPTPFVLQENQKSDHPAGEFGSSGEPEKDLKRQTAENWTMKTDSVDLSPYQLEKEPVDRKSEPDVNAFGKARGDDLLDQQPITGAKNSTNDEAEDLLSFSNEPHPNENDNLRSSFTSKEPKPSFQLDIAPADYPRNESSQSVVDQQPNFGSSQPSLKAEEVKPKEEPDFQSTIPYTPKDFANQDSIASKLADKQSSDSLNAEGRISSANLKSDISAPIAPPEVPVGSSMHSSLEPRSISVQIYDPKERPDLESKTIIKTTGATGDVKSRAEQEKAKEARAYTSPNIGVGDTDGKGKAKLKPLDEGTVLNNRYEIIRKIGGGGMGAVYLASDKNLGGISRAVKEMVQSYIEDSQQEKAINDFRRESMLLTSLEHSSIPTIYDYFFDEKEARFYLVMKYISGGDLSARLRSASEGKIDEASVTEWAIQLADVLDYLHNRQPPIVYRDLKPSNIMIDGNSSKVMLIDFGIARWVNKEEKGVTAVGTMGYAPPELFSGNVEPRSDIYSLGSTMFHLLTGADPQSNPLLIFDFNKNPRPRKINPLLTDQMEQILMKMVEYSADKRYASAAELRNTLVKHLEDLKKGNVTTGVSENVNAGAAANQLVFCGFCGQKILGTDVFCPFCGAQQTGAGQAAKMPGAFVPQKSTARLVIVGTNELDSPVFILEKENNLVGRRDPMSNIFPEVDLSKFDPQTKISRRHARIWRERDSFMVEDLGSSNGTVLISKINEPQKLMKNQPHVLVNGDKIRVGDTTLFFAFD